MTTMQTRYAILLALVGALQLPSQTPKTAQTKLNPTDDLTYVWIPPGTFTMGCSLSDSECARDESPASKVTIAKGFWMGQTPVTQEAYQRVTGKNPGYFKGAKFPADSMSWDEAQSYDEGHRDAAYNRNRVGIRSPRRHHARAGTAILDQIAWYGANSEPIRRTKSCRRDKAERVESLRHARQRASGVDSRLVLPLYREPARPGSARKA